MEQRDPLPRAREVAKLLIINAHRYAKEREKDPLPYRFNSVSLRLIAGRSTLRASFVNKVYDNLKGFGWILIEIDDKEYAIIPVERTEMWAKLGAKRVKTLALDNDIDEIDRAFKAEVTPPATLDFDL
ncbi:hypothetical protein [Achromobacter xylosoxidans]|uniref:hypothetical protein n=1 Tax=Alcaligenes xylosoxydans xylosoxydans TaxID=85698 RepID=UPI001F13072A|nr:hypothetical protein [Achromobacter xylosoxidans]